MGSRETGLLWPQAKQDALGYRPRASVTGRAQHRQVTFTRERRARAHRAQVLPSSWGLRACLLPVHAADLRAPARETSPLAHLLPSPPPPLGGFQPSWRPPQLSQKKPRSRLPTLRIKSTSCSTGRGPPRGGGPPHREEHLDECAPLEPPPSGKGGDPGWEEKNGSERSTRSQRMVTLRVVTSSC